MTGIFRRPTLARELAAKLLRPSVLDLGLRSGLFIAGQRRTGKTTFLRHDLIPAIEDMGAVVVYVDLWTDTKVDPAKLVIDAVRQTLRQLEDAKSPLVARLRRVSSLSVEAFGFSLGFDIEQVGLAGGVTLAEAFKTVVESAKTDVILIVDEVQQALTSEEGSRLLFALKAARDAINKTPSTPGYFLFLGTGSHRAKVAELSARRQQAFDGAVSLDYPLLGEDYVAQLWEEVRPIAESRNQTLPSFQAAYQAFVELGHRPEELLKAIRTFLAQGVAAHQVDGAFGLIAATLRAAAADVELERLLALGQLAVAIFDKIASAGTETKGIYSTAAAEQYARIVGRDVKVDEIQPVVLAMQDQNLIMRTGQGLYAVSDPFVQVIWLENRDSHLLGALALMVGSD